MIIEFQHSTISPDEVAAREAFYGKMIWIINGNNPKNFDRDNFFLSIASGEVILSKHNTRLIRFHWYGRGKLFARWSASDVPVFFDFGGSELWWLKSFDATNREVVMQVVGKADLIIKNGGTYSADAVE